MNAGFQNLQLHLFNYYPALVNKIPLQRQIYGSVLSYGSGIINERIVKHNHTAITETIKSNYMFTLIASLFTRRALKVTFICELTDKFLWQVILGLEAEK